MWEKVQIKLGISKEELENSCINLIVFLDTKFNLIQKRKNIMSKGQDSRRHQKNRLKHERKKAAKQIKNEKNSGSISLK